jgi:hypothetical protein
MFDYADPTGRAFLNQAGVAKSFQDAMSRVYDRFARRQDSSFTWLEAFDALTNGATPRSASVDWVAFPLLASATDQEIDRKRFDLQDEYVEWHVERTPAGAVKQVIFTTEFPEYFEAFAAVGSSSLSDAVRDVIPGASPTAAELFGTATNVDALPSQARIQRFRNNLKRNPYNDGTKGILCLTQGANTLGALFHLVTECAVVRQGEPEDSCGLVGGACGPGRASDPNVCTAAQRAARNRIALTLQDPAGVRIVRLEGIWKIDGQQIDINDAASNRGAWTIARNGRRAILKIVNGLTIGDAPVTTGAQVSRVVRVAADLKTVADNALPEWARRGKELESRGPTT